MLIEAMFLSKSSTTFGTGMSFLLEETLASSLFKRSSKATDVRKEAMIPYVQPHVQS